ncbi:TetR/AcrR family transcriptional regulator [Nocardia sp. NPDC058176]|uniref:TetR/AcrR family transcriptional regulator n=1 Tax=Nocardia sp. NPDC058176 TaxID=3346368 RepID=UPI0036D844F6
MTHPARKTRPSNRRALILSAAAQLFRRDGYPKVGMKDIADAVAVAPSSLYHHFPTKNDLLEAVVSDALTTAEQILLDALDRPGDDFIAELASRVSDARAIGVLWRRESRHLSDDTRHVLRSQIQRIGAALAALIHRDRPELDSTQADFLAWAVLAVVTSVSFHNIDTPPELIEPLMRNAATAEVPPLQRIPSVTVAPRPWWPSRREQILATATQLFAAHGFTGVSLEDIGAAIGITGPSIYNHFATKAEILSAAMMRGNEILRADLYRAFEHSISPIDALTRLIDSYREFAMTHGDIIELLVSEVDQLPDAERSQSRAAQHAYITEWVGVLRQVLERADESDARIRVQAILFTINDIATTSHLRLKGADRAITSLALRLAGTADRSRTEIPIS